MKTFVIYRESFAGQPVGNWRWQIRASNRKIVAEGGEGYCNATDLVRTVRKQIVRDSGLLETALCRALKRAGLDEKGRVAK